MVTCEINNLTAYQPDKKIIGEIMSVFGRTANIKREVSLSLAFITPASIRKWNRLYRGQDKVTDVLSFEADGSGEGDNSIGEILICSQRIKSQAKEYGWSVDREMARLLVHGLAHLIGYDHENVSAKKAKEMELFEANIMKGLKR